MWDYKKNLQDNKVNKCSPAEMASKLYLSYPTSAFSDLHELEYRIRNRVRNLYNIPLSSVQVIGSAKTGFSLIKKTDFISGKSDLDLAIIDPGLFNRLWEEANQLSNGYEATKFQDVRGDDGEIVVGLGRKRFLSYLQRGIISPEFLPSGPMRRKITEDFNRITNDYLCSFKKISAFFYASEFFLQEKLKETIIEHWDQI